MSVNCWPRVPTLIPRILSWIPRVPTLIPDLPILSPLVTAIPLIPFPDFPFRLLQVAILNDSNICEVKQTFKKYI